MSNRYTNLRNLFVRAAELKLPFLLNRANAELKKIELGRLIPSEAERTVGNYENKIRQVVINSPKISNLTIDEFTNRLKIMRLESEKAEELSFETEKEKQWLNFVKSWETGAYDALNGERHIINNCIFWRGKHISELNSFQYHEYVMAINAIPNLVIKDVLLEKTPKPIKTMPATDMIRNIAY